MICWERPPRPRRVKTGIPSIFLAAAAAAAASIWGLQLRYTDLMTVC